jgi:dTDP-4-dehydrorhamnose 3,5-epimerase
MIEGVVIKELKLIPDERGYLMEMLRDDDPFFEDFGQCYISATYPGVVKGWHFHEKQVDHFVCVKGMVKVVMYDHREESPTKGEVQEFFLGEERRILLRVPNGVYHGWKCIGNEMSLVLNIPNRHYDYDDPDEFRLDPHDNDIPYDWARKDG